MVHPLPAGSGSLVVANVFDAGLAKTAGGLAFETVATLNVGFAATLGQKEGRITHEEALSHARAVVEATGLPASAGLENGFADAPEAVAETVRGAVQAGLITCTTNDATREKDQSTYPFDAEHERNSASIEAAQSLDFDFKLTERCENFLRGKPDLDDTIRYLQTYEKAGATVLMATGSVRAVCQAVSRPFNSMAGIPGEPFAVAELEAAEV